MCDRIAIPGGGFALVCRGHGRGRARARCFTCGTRKATKLCDGPGVGDGVTCDRPLCDLCAHARGQGDYCDDCLPKRPRLAL